MADDTDKPTDKQAVTGEVVEHDELTEQLPLMNLDGEPWYDPSYPRRQTIAVPRKGYGPDNLRLNPNQEAFCQAYCYSGAAQGNATEAYRLAYGAPDRFSASKLLRKAHIAARIEELNQAAIDEAGITVESYLLNLRRLSRKAEAGDNLGVSAQYEKLIGQVIGALSDKVSLTVEDKKSAAELESELRQIVSKDPRILKVLGAGEGGTASEQVLEVLRQVGAVPAGRGEGENEE
jgi:hypothetical protein